MYIRTLLCICHRRCSNSIRSIHKDKRSTSRNKQHQLQTPMASEIVISKHMQYLSKDISTYTKALQFSNNLNTLKPFKNLLPNTPLLKNSLNHPSNNTPLNTTPTRPPNPRNLLLPSRRIKQSRII